ncbi:MAG: hypothetical protein RIQ81_2600, partial [Pseudomonadota bacterium]
MTTTFSRHLVLAVTALFISTGCQPAESRIPVVSQTDAASKSISQPPEFQMTRELPDITRRLTNELSTCWLQAGIKELEMAHYRVTGDVLELSEEFTMMSALHDRFLRIIQGSKIKSVELEGGGEMNEVRRLAVSYGLMPDRTWGQGAKEWGEMAKELNPLAATHREEFRAAIKAGQSTDGVIEDAEAHFSDLLDSYEVHVPTWFRVAGKKTNPVDFAASFASENYRDYVMYVARAHYPRKPTKRELFTDQDSFRTSWENIAETIVSQIDDGRSVLLTIIWSNRVIDVEDGVMRVSGRPTRP